MSISSACIRESRARALPQCVFFVCRGRIEILLGTANQGHECFRSGGAVRADSRLRGFGARRTLGCCCLGRSTCGSARIDKQGRARGEARDSHSHIWEMGAAIVPSGAYLVLCQMCATTCWQRDSWTHLWTHAQGVGGTFGLVDVRWRGASRLASGEGSSATTM